MTFNFLQGGQEDLEECSSFSTFWNYFLLTLSDVCGRATSTFFIYCSITVKFNEAFKHKHSTLNLDTSILLAVFVLTQSHAAAFF